MRTSTHGPPSCFLCYRKSAAICVEIDSISGNTDEPEATRLIM